jgi:predicted RNase H-like nuclease
LSHTTKKLTPLRLVGIDGCKAGWVLAISGRELEEIEFSITDDLTALIEIAETSRTLVLVDIPIGLEDGGPRAVDVAARRLLGAPRNSSVFPPPVRSALHAVSYLDACATNRLACGSALSKQLWQIVPRIRQVDAAITPARQQWVHEAHPEVCFAVMSGTGRGLVHSKKTPAGEAERLAILRRWAPSFEVSEVRALLGLGRVARDDILDAVACLASAHRLAMGQALVLPGEPIPVDSCGLRMEMVA